jgi:hypothetical protein
MEFSSDPKYMGDLIKPPVYVGGYRFGNDESNYIQMNLTYKPKWLHRQCCRIFFGLYWFDENK